MLDARFASRTSVLRSGLDVVKLLSVESYPKKSPITVLGALSTGFDTVTRQLWLLTLPVGMDLLLWLGPRLHAAGIWPLTAFDIPSGLDAQTRLFAQQMQSAARQTFEGFNWLAWLRPPLFGVPGLMAGGEQPGPAGGSPAAWQVGEPAALIVIVVALCAAGIGLGALYWSLIARQARDGRIDWAAALGRLPGIWQRLIGVALIMILLALAIWLPATLIGLVMGSALRGITTLIVVLAFSLLTWLLFYTTFSIHGVVLYNQHVLEAVRASVQLARAHFWSVFGMLAAFIAIDFGMRLIWNLASIDSWLWLAAIAGNAFVVTGLSMATMVFYMDRVPIPGSALIPHRT